MRETLSRDLPDAEITFFEWNGKNTQKDRYNASRELSLLLNTYRHKFYHLCIVAHSHGGNVAMQAINFSRVDNVSLVTLGTPFIEVGRSRPLPRVGLLFVMLFSAPILLALATFVRDLWSNPMHATKDLIILFSIAFIFAVFVTQWDSKRERLQELTRRRFESVFERFDALSLPRYVDLLVIKYKSTGKIRRDEVLAASSLARWIVSRATLHSRRTRPVLEGVTKSRSFLSFSIFVLFTVIVLWLNANTINSSAINFVVLLAAIALAVWIAGVAAKMVFAAVLMYLQNLFRFKFFGLGIGSFSLVENTLVYSKTNEIPSKDQVNPKRLLIREIDGEHRLFHTSNRLFHTSICVEPDAAAEIVTWCQRHNFAGNR